MPEHPSAGIMIKWAGQIQLLTRRHHVLSCFNSMVRSLGTMALVICLSVISLLTACSNDGIALSNRVVDREVGLIELGTMDQSPSVDEASMKFDPL